QKALGAVFHQTGRFKEAERAFQSALPVWEKLVADFNQPDHRGHLLTTRTYLVQVLVQLAEQAEKDARLSEAARKAAVQAYLERVKVLRQEAAQMALAAADAEALNNLVWPLVAAAGSRFLDPAPAVELASKAVALKPDASHIWNTLGVAQYRAGSWKAALTPLKKSHELSCGSSFSTDGFFLAMAHWQMGEKERARKGFAAVDLWVKNSLRSNEELRRFRSEAAALLGLPEKAPAAPSEVRQDNRDVYT